MQISFEHSGLWLIPALLIAVMLAWWIYWYRNQWEADRFEDWSPTLKSVATVLRAFVFTALAFLILEPFIITLINEQEKPLLLVYSDHSESVSEVEQKVALDWIDKHREVLSDKYDIRTYKFGSQVSELNDSLSNVSLNTDFSTVVESVNEDHYNQNIGAVLVATDGIQNLGQDPRYLSFNSAAPLFIRALGDTTISPDFEVSEVLNNDLVFLGNAFQIKVRISSKKMAGYIANIKLMRDNELIKVQEQEIKLSDASFEVVFQLEADRVGLIRYTILVEPRNGEVNIENNSAETFIDVLDNRTQISIITKAPHPDIAAIKSAIETNDQYEVSVSTLEKWDENADNIDLAILHGLPTGPNDLNKLKVIRDKRIPTLSIVTPSVSWLHFQRLELGVELKSNRASSDEAGGWVNEGFNLFNPPTNDYLDRYPPLNVVFGDYSFIGEHQVVLNQRIGSINSEKPLLGISSSDSWKRAVLLGEGWWRWRLFERMQFDEDWTDKILVKTVQYLALKQKRTRLLVSAPELVDEGAEVKMEAEYYNETYELTNDNILNLDITDSSGTKQSYKFQTNGNGYKINVGTLPSGSYTWRAHTNSNGSKFEQSGEFLITENKAEFIRTTAQFGFLNQWASQSEGEVFYKGMDESLLNRLTSLETAKPIIHTSKEWESIIDWKWIALLIMLMVSIEWFLRKFNGYY